jgi:N-acetylmuramoyl-L-alanine amidase
MPAVGYGLLLITGLAVGAQAITNRPESRPVAIRPERVVLFGTEYARVDQWAATNRLKSEWITRNRQLRLSGPGNLLILEADARTISINGIAVHLSAPIAVRNGAAFVAPVDLSATLQPLLSPSSQSRKITNICIDPGHGGKDPGHLAGKNLEKKYTLLLARELGDQLGKAGFKVSYTRSSDTFVELPARSEVAKKKNADLFVSLHFNSFDGPGAEGVNGAEVYCMTPAHAASTNARGEGSAMGSCVGNRFDAKNILLAYQMQKALTTKLALEDRGVRRARFAVLRNAEMPAILIECGFLSNAAEAKKIYDSKYRQELAKTIVQGVQEYKRVVGAQ